MSRARVADEFSSEVPQHIRRKGCYTHEKAEKMGRPTCCGRFRGNASRYITGSLQPYIAEALRCHIRGTLQPVPRCPRQARASWYPRDPEPEEQLMCLLEVPQCNMKQKPGSKRDFSTSS